MSIEIKCVKKDNGNHYNKHEAITAYGWWDVDEKKIIKSLRKTITDWIDADKENHTAYVVDKDTGKKAYCYVRENQYGTRFLQTYADGDWRNNLLNLPEC